ncbi:DUF423 domain-containing protein [Christiangramia fulva]|uniref:DUF423 domain-containing protein n=1 Tax=Christiangramia fulva TaxID=2126553 RepID=A0A2R3Z4R8_9FLAO|nr:DUF423 domain-containing protein [Christiangramia fulva]AVR45228.1 DUF423 domain-containing protein [Christiangramia fulva]
MERKFFITGAILGLLAVILGAFGAHGLKQIVPAEAVTSFETGVRYQMYHAFLLLIIGSLSRLNLKYLKTIFLLILIGVIFFSGSIYLLSINSLTNFDFRVIALLTPLGGSLLITAWILLLVSFVKLKNK